MRLRLDFSYNGTRYNGYQRQGSKSTIQSEIEDALSKFFGSDITICASGRTDAGVSAMHQVAHFDVLDDVLLKKIKVISEKELKSLAIRINYELSENIRILNISKVDVDFHARYNAKEKTYLYNFYTSDVEIPYLSQFCLWLKEKNLNIDLMKDALKVFVGEHDFTSFCASNTDVKDKVRNITKVGLSYNELGFYTISISGTGFLYNMVRIIVGTIFDVGREKLTKEDVKEILELRDRTKASKTVPAKGLVLKEVKM